MHNVHVITSADQKKAIEIIRWCMAVPGIPADSPRFNYYVSRWRVPDKIEAARESGTLETTLSKSPPIDPAWVRLVPAALAEYEAFTKPTTPANRQPAQSSGIARRPRNRARRVA